MLVIRKAKKKTCDEKSAIKRSNETKKKAALASVEHEKKNMRYTFNKPCDVLEKRKY